MSLEWVKITADGMWSGSHDLFKFWEIIDNVYKTIQDRDIVTMEHVSYRMAPILALKNFEFQKTSTA